MANIVLSRIRSAFSNFFVQTANLFFLKLWGEVLDCHQLEATFATDTVEFELYEPFLVDKIIPKGTRIQTKDGLYNFLTDTDLIINAGEINGVVNVTSELAGAILNEYGAGEINILIENYDFIKSAVNLNGATGGSDEEDVERYRQRLLLAPEKFSNAGSYGAYKYFTLSSHQDIVDASIVSITPGVVDIYVLGKNGTAEEDIIKTVLKTVNADNIRPLTDKVNVYSVENIDFELNATLTLTLKADYEITTNSVNEALYNYFEDLKKSLNKEIVPSDIIALIKGIDGVYDFMPEDLTIKAGFYNKYYNGSIGEIEIKRASK